MQALWGLHSAAPVDRLDDVEQQRSQLLGRHRIKQIADLPVAGDAVDTEQRSGVVAPTFLLHALLVVEERRTLGEGYRKEAEGGVLQRVVLLVATLAPAGQAAGGLVNLLHQ